MNTELFEIKNAGLWKYNGKEKNVVIAPGVEIIGDNAFMDNTGIEFVEIPEGVRKIGVGAFCRCRNLKKVSLPDSLEKIGMGAFAMCGALEEIEIPEKVTGIGCSAFLYCNALKSVNYNAVRCKNISSDGNYNYYTYSDYGNFYDDIFPVFYGCNNLKTVNIGEKVKYIPSELFSCSDIKKINVNTTEKLKIGFNAFRHDTELNKIIYCNTGAEIISEPLKKYSFPLPQVNIYTTVMHKIWGEGTVLEIIPEEKLIKVGFEGQGIKAFAFPDAFYTKHLTVVE